VLHEGYNGATIQNDIGIIKLKTPIEFNENAQAIRLCQNKPIANRDVVNTGWGNAHPQGGTPVILPDLLQKVTLKAMSNLVCRSSYPLVLKDYMVCAIGAEEDGPSGACNGDSGGPLVHLAIGAPDYCLAGIVSFGRQPCGNAPSVYTSVPSFLDWISQNQN